MVARLRAFWVLARQRSRLACRDSCARGPRGRGDGSLGFRVAHSARGPHRRSLPTGSGSRGKKRGRERRDSGPGRGRNAGGCVGAWDVEVERVRRGTRSWAGGLATWREKSLDGARGGIHSQAGRKLGPLYEGKGWDGGSGERGAGPGNQRALTHAEVTSQAKESLTLLFFKCVSAHTYTHTLYV